MRTAAIYKKDVLCGTLVEDEEGYTFLYDEQYLQASDSLPLSPTVPLTEKSYQNIMMLPVFDGLIPEGWLLDIAEKVWKIDPRDRMSLLLTCCKDCIGDISVRPIDEQP